MPRPSPSRHELLGMDVGRDNQPYGERPRLEDKAPYAFTGTVAEGGVRHPAGDHEPGSMHEHAALHAVAAGATE